MVWVSANAPHASKERVRCVQAPDPQTDENHGALCNLPEAQHQHTASRACGISVSAPGPYH